MFAGDVGRDEIRNRLDDSAVGHVAARVVVFADNENAWMRAAVLDNQLVEIVEVVVKIESHSPRRIRARSSGGIGLGVGLYL